jgi:osmotically-inducible protein OsmY
MRYPGSRLQSGRTGGHPRQPITTTASWLYQDVETAMIDVTLDHRVLTALERSPHITRRNFRCETELGRVTLKGVVDSFYQKQMAQEAIRHVDGVHEITNELEVCWS